MEDLVCRRQTAFLARKEDDWQCYVKEDQLANTEALSERHVAHAVPGTGELLYAPFQGGGARRDGKQAVRKNKARARQAVREESWTPRKEGGGSDGSAALKSGTGGDTEGGRPAAIPVGPVRLLHAPDDKGVAGRRGERIGRRPE